MCEVMRSPTLDMASHPLRLRQPTQTTGRRSNISPPLNRRSVPSFDMFAKDFAKQRSEAKAIARRRIKSASDEENVSPPRDGLLKRKGRLTMEAPTCGTAATKRTTKIPVVLSVYCTPFDQYAVISQERVVCKDCGYVNLKNCYVRAIPDGFQISTCDGEKRPLVFYASDKEDLEAWVTVLDQCTSVHKEMLASKPMAIPSKVCGAGVFASGSPSRAHGFLNTSPRSHPKPLLSLTALSEEEEEEQDELSEASEE